MTKTRAFYSGDINIENGGMFYSLATLHWGYVDAVRVTPCSDAGGPDNMFWVENITINLPDTPEKLAAMLDSWGMDELPKGAARNHALVQLADSWGSYERDEMEQVQIGPRPEHCRDPHGFIPTKVLRADASLRRYARSRLSQ